MSGPGGEVDWHNQSIQSDYVNSSLRPDNKLEAFDYEEMMQ